MVRLFFSCIAILFFAVALAQTNQNDEQGRKHGLWKGVYEESKRPRYEGTFEHGKEIGTFKFFDDTKAGTVIATREFAPDGSAYTTFYDQKKSKVSEGKVVSREYEGLWKYYHEASTVVMTTENYKNGKLEGKRTVYYKNGKLAEETTYVAGIKTGPYKKYADNEANVVLEESVYKNGIIEGPALYRNPDGTIASKGNYVNGEKKGVWEFYEGGKLKKKETYPLRKKLQKLEKRKDF
ncbi:MAG: hypothetical protein EOO50_05410 [Flavobacterium sp.]|uniref:toxin-antitoxin system YwqK family antitoxin n=1 Tax=Flavobacterium sp. TaxID=239 RepID=UPI00120AF017|nr:hypothetical protein [Flavobacterium sp.]RZJ67426.1 MAG: hypothetical protein EOO50_05410 [Flavobacterium sp.]